MSDATTQLESPSDRRTIRARLAATKRAVSAADEAVVRTALGRVSWERRGLLQRLTYQPLG
jgi:hypothetical protein